MPKDFLLKENKDFSLCTLKCRKKCQKVPIFIEENRWKLQPSILCKWDPKDSEKESTFLVQPSSTNHCSMQTTQTRVRWGWLPFLECFTGWLSHKKQKVKKAEKQMEKAIRSQFAANSIADTFQRPFGLKNC